MPGERSAQDHEPGHGSGRRAGWPADPAATGHMADRIGGKSGRLPRPVAHIQAVDDPVMRASPGCQQRPVGASATAACRPSRHRGQVTARVKGPEAKSSRRARHRLASRKMRRIPAATAAGHRHVQHLCHGALVRSASRDGIAGDTEPLATGPRPHPSCRVWTGRDFRPMHREGKARPLADVTGKRFQHLAGRGVGRTAARVRPRCGQQAEIGTTAR